MYSNILTTSTWNKDDQLSRVAIKIATLRCTRPIKPHTEKNTDSFKSSRLFSFPTSGFAFSYRLHLQIQSYNFITKKIKIKSINKVLLQQFHSIHKTKSKIKFKDSSLHFDSQTVHRDYSLCGEDSLWTILKTFSMSYTWRPGSPTLFAVCTPCSCHLSSPSVTCHHPLEIHFVHAHTPYHYLYFYSSYIQYTPDRKSVL